MSYWLFHFTGFYKTIVNVMEDVITFSFLTMETNPFVYSSQFIVNVCVGNKYNDNDFTDVKETTLFS